MVGAFWDLLNDTFAVNLIVHKALVDVGALELNHSKV